MNLTLKLLEAYIARIDVTESNYYIFEELLKQPYDIYRPIMDMLFDGTIVIEDLVMPSGQSIASSSSTTSSSQLSRWDISPTAVSSRCLALVNGTTTSVTVTSVDNSSLLTNPSTSLIGASYIPSETTVISTDSSMITPNPIEVARSTSYTEAQKSVQESLLAAIAAKVS